MDELRTIVEALPNLLTAGAYNGNWTDAATRNHVKKRIEAAILDLSEALDLRRELESRFSHRAFLPTARALIDRGKRFASWWTRLVGGYSKYRMEVADLYKVPYQKPKLFLMIYRNSIHSINVLQKSIVPIKNSETHFSPTSLQISLSHGRTRSLH